MLQSNCRRRRSSCKSFLWIKQCSTDRRSTGNSSRKRNRDTFADGISLQKIDLAGRCYAMLDKAQIPYNLKSAIQAVVEKMGKDGVATLATMNLSPALMGAVLELLTA